MDGPDEPRIPRVVSERAPNLGNQYVQAAVHHVRLGPHLRVQIGLLEHFRPVLEEQAKQVEGFGGQMEGGLAPAQLPRLRIDSE
jgi:hypothetical protein